MTKKAQDFLIERKVLCFLALPCRDLPLLLRFLFRFGAAL